MVTDMLEFCLQDKTIKWRISWFNEVKIPMLTMAVLVDNGQESLSKRIDSLHKLIT